MIHNIAVAHLVVGWLSFLIKSLVFVPLCLYCIAQLKQHENEPYIRNRFPGTLYLMSICLLQEIVFGNTIQDIDYGYNLSITHTKFYTFYYQISGLASVLAFLLKCWLVVFKFKHQYAIVNQEWQAILIPQLTKKSRNVWIKYKPILGMSIYSMIMNTRHMVLVVVLILFFQTLITHTNTNTNTNHKRNICKH